MNETDNIINTTPPIICLSNVNFISKQFIKNTYFREMGNICSNGDFLYRNNHM